MVEEDTLNLPLTSMRGWARLLIDMHIYNKCMLSARFTAYAEVVFAGFSCVRCFPLLHAILCENGGSQFIWGGG